MPERPPLRRDEVYFVESDDDPTALIACRAGTKDGWVYWDDTNRDRAHRIARVQRVKSTIIVHTDRGWVYRFTPMSIELYDDRVRGHVELSPAFRSTQELRAFYLGVVL